MYNKRMNEEELSVAVGNEKEWRKMMFRKLEKVDDRVRGLEIKNAFFAGTIAIVVSIISNIIMK